MTTENTSRLSNALADRYKIESRLGEGGMAIVYLAEDLKHQRKVALKVLRPELAVAIGTDRFLREIRIAANLNHPHIVPLHDSGETDGFLYYTMPYIEGQTLGDRLKSDAPIPSDEGLRILCQVADALAFAHSRGVVHRDIKPDNVMLTERHAVVTDFGIAKALGGATEGEALTSVGLAIGTPAYMAPEQAAADPRIDHRADIYALGVVAYEVLTGQPPFAGRPPQALLAAHVNEIPVPVTERRASVSAQVAAVVMRCSVSVHQRASPIPRTAPRHGTVRWSRGSCQSQNGAI